MKPISFTHWPWRRRMASQNLMTPPLFNQTNKMAHSQLKSKNLLYRGNQYFSSGKIYPSLSNIELVHPRWRHIFRVTDHLCGEFTGHRWIPHTKASDASFDVFFDLCLIKRLSKQSWGWWFETPLRPLWRDCNATFITIILHVFAHIKIKCLAAVL